MTTDSTGRMTLREKIAAMPTREEWLGGQRTKYVQLEEVLGYIDAHLTPRPVTVSDEDAEWDGWIYRAKGPKEGGDQRCICTIKVDAMVYVGIAIWTANFQKWFQNGTPITGLVLAWKPLPEPAKGGYVNGKIHIPGNPALEADRQRGGAGDGVKVVDAEPNKDMDITLADRHHLFVYEVDFGDEGKGRYIRLRDFNAVVSKLETLFTQRNQGGVREGWVVRSSATEQKWNAMGQVVSIAKTIADYLAEFGTLEGIPETFDALYYSLDKCKAACDSAAPRPGDEEKGK